jgi:hypothetical protein
MSSAASVYATPSPGSCAAVAGGAPDDEVLKATCIGDLIFDEEEAVRTIREASSGDQLRRVIEKLPKSREKFGRTITLNRVVKVWEDSMFFSRCKR